MTLQYSTTVNNARLDAIESSIGVSPTLEIRTGPPPATPATADAGTVLATLTLPSDWMNAASGGSKTRLGTWQDLSADATGKPGHFRIKASTTTHIQGIACGPWAPSTAYAIGDTVTNDSNKVYRATAAGTSAASGGPTGTAGSGITDGGVTWGYIQAAPDMALDSGTLTAGQAFTIGTFTLTAGNV